MYNRGLPLANNNNKNIRELKNFKTKLCIAQKLKHRSVSISKKAVMLVYLCIPVLPCLITLLLRRVIKKHINIFSGFIFCLVLRPLCINEPDKTPRLHLPRYGPEKIVSMFASLLCIFYLVVFQQLCLHRPTQLFPFLSVVLAALET